MSEQILPAISMEPELARCPWCGCGAIIDTWQPKSGGTTFFGRCYSPACNLPGPERATHDEARTAWNNWLVTARMILMPDLSGGGGA